VLTDWIVSRNPDGAGVVEGANWSMGEAGAWGRISGRIGETPAVVRLGCWLDLG